jgi:hypothetical protein
MSLRSEVRSVSGFTKVRVNGYGKITLLQGDHESLSVEADEEFLEKIVSAVSDGKLTIGFRTEWWDWITSWFDWATVKDKTINYTISMKEIEGIELDGSTSLTAEDLKSSLFELSIRGSAEVNLKGVYCDQLTTFIRGSSKMNLGGTARKHDIKLNGSAKVDAFELETQETNLRISGSGIVELYAVQILDISISGSGQVHYRGNPKISQRIAGSGWVREIKSSQQQE